MEVSIAQNKEEAHICHRKMKQTGRAIQEHCFLSCGIVKTPMQKLNRQFSLNNNIVYIAGSDILFDSHKAQSRQVLLILKCQGIS